MQDMDVVIIGGGPAGSSFAWALRDSGLKVLIIDKHTFPRDKVCAGWVTPAVLDALRFDLNHYAESNILQPITGFRIGLMGSPAVENRYAPRVVSYGIRRCEFDAYLLNRCGASVSMGVPVEDIQYDGAFWYVNHQVRARLLVGAGGHFCPVARHLGAKVGQSETVVAAKEVEFEMDEAQRAQCQVREHVPELYFCEDLKGYAWVFRKGNVLNIGLGREDSHRLGDHLHEFVEALQLGERIPVDLGHRFKGHAYILYDHSHRKLIGPQSLVLGDAAGLAYTQSGEGIRPAVESGLLAADCVIRASGDYSGAQLRHYQRAIQARFGPRRSDRLLRIALPGPLKHHAARVLMQTQWFTRNVVTDRWFLHAHQQPLAL